MAIPSIFAIISLVSCIISFFIASFIFFKDRKNMLNLVFTLALLSTSLWLFCEFMFRQAPDSATASFWIRIHSFVWTFPLTFLLHFILIYTRNKLLDHKLTYLFIYGPGLVFSLLDPFTSLLTGPPIREYWGYTYEIPDTMINYVSLTWAFVAGIVALIICFWYFYKLPEGIIKKQAKFVTIGLSFPVLCGTFTESVIPFILKIRIPEFFGISIVLLCLVVTYAIVKYQLFTLTPESAINSIMSSITDCLFLIDSEGKIVYHNNAVVSFLGYTRSELKTINLRHVLKKDLDFFNSSSNQPRSDIETMFKKKNGDFVHVSFSSSPVFDTKGKLQGHVIISRDITMRKQEEAKLLKNNKELRRKDAEITNFNKRLKEANQKLTELDRRKDEFISLVSHELKTPLTSIKGFSQLLKNKRIDNKKKEYYLELIDNNTERLGKLIYDIVDSSRISLGKLQMDIKPVSVYSIVKDSKSNMQMIIKEKGLNLKYKIETGLPNIDADGERVLQVIMNLITNAVKYTQKGTVEFSVYKKGDYVQFEVKDSGQGIPKKHQPLIFTRFYQVDGSFTRKFGGSGLGLSVCKGIVESMKGKIWFDSVEGKGSTFYFKIPIAKKISHRN